MLTRHLTILVLAFVSTLVSAAAAAEPPSRVANDLVVLYTFERPKENRIRDQSGLGEPLDLVFDKVQGLAWRSRRLTVSGPVSINSSQPAKKITSAVKQSGELTIEVWIKPNDNHQDGPARIVTLSSDPGQRNFTLGQDGGKFDVRFRTTATNQNGIPSVSTPNDAVRADLTHLVYTRTKSGSVTIFLNGKAVVSQQVDGDVSNWGEDYRLSLANELTGDRPWRGELHLVALYSRALSEQDVQQNFSAGIRETADFAVLPPAVGRKVDFVADVQPILRKRCFDCHAQGNEEGGLDLGIRRRALSGGANGPVIIPGKSSDSSLVHMIASLDKSEAMPPDGDRLTNDEIGVIRAWIDQGADWPSNADVVDPRLEQARKHWAFQPLKAPAVPSVRDESWTRTPIDHFNLASLEKAGLQPSAPASPRALVRRMYFDVTGLPPTPDQIDTFCKAADSDRQVAVRELAERLLSSSHFGERWGRHWLDVARYADSDGQESDNDRPQAWRYRDFVVRAFNDDMPFDRFLRWQLAGNEYEPANPAAVAATGFLTAGPFAVLGDNLMEEERIRTRYDELDDIVSTIGTGMLGLTLGCARCHNHKYDAIPARDYYGLVKALQSGQRDVVMLGESKDKVFAYREAGPEPKPAWLFRRGDFYDHSQPISLGFVSLFTRDKQPEDYLKLARDSGTATNSTNQRRALADWITDTKDGAGALVARVIVNRIWQHHFGDALVRTVGDFGVRSEAPTHPELLEWLADDFVQNGWKPKRLHQMILTSSVYQQSTGVGGASIKSDPENRLRGRMRPQRLQAEILRDAMLAVSGTLNMEQYGPGFKPPIHAEAMVARNLQDPYPPKVDDNPSVRRRSIYMFHKRVVPYPLLQAFDRPDAQQSCNRREPTTVAPQALALLNDQFVRTASVDFANRLLKEAGDSPNQWVERGYLLALGRQPTDVERTASRDFVENQIKERSARSPQDPADQIRRLALADLCQAWFSLNEFLYVD